MFNDGTKTLWLASSRTGQRTGYELDSFVVPVSQLIQNGVNVRNVSVGFALYSVNGAYDGKWSIDDIKIGPYMGSLAASGVVPAGDPKTPPMASRTAP